MKKLPAIPRRRFIQLSAMSGAFLALGCTMTTGKEVSIVNLNLASDDLGTSLNAYIFITSDGKITIYNHRPEMGQGTYQSIPMIIAEELEVSMADINIQQSPANREKYGDQMVVGSRSIQSSFDLMRKVGATAKVMLVMAAANQWKIAPEDCNVENAHVINTKTKQKLSYGALVKGASTLPIPENVTLKNPRDFKIIGKSFPRMDIPSKINGEAKFGMDIQVPNMLYASVERSPVFDGKVVAIKDDKAKTIPGVRHVLKTERQVYGKVREGVAVLADSYWAAEQGRQALEITWDNANLESWSTEKIKADYKEASTQKGVTFKEVGDVDKVYGSNTKVVEAAYETPYQSHATMEPMNAIVSVGNDRCEFWGSTQNPNGVRSQLARQLGIPEEKVAINYTFMGCGFGRRSMTDVAEEAADLSKKAGVPVKVIWSRDDDNTQGPFRACSLNVLKGAVTNDGKLMALEHKVICQDIRNQTGDNPDASGAIVSGINTEYAIPNYKISGVLRKFYVPITYWRSVYHSTNCFAHESFIDELAHAAGKDPIDFRIEILKDHKRYTHILKTVAEKTNWYGTRNKNQGKGVAIAERSGALMAMVAEVERVNGKVKITKVTTVLDCGIPVNPDTIKAQTEGSTVMGLTATYKSGLTIKNGRVVEKNFDTYPMLMLDECPELEVHVVSSTEKPEGVGEAGLPTTAPAVTNAIFDLTKKRIRELPFKLEDV